ncbi:MAG: hypothetical protein GQ527_02835 [Bacteroidales bacterium]|nr:hypothetical protein [Bacteroidales bacterium]
MLPNSFYLAFGNLLYSIAMSDNEVQIEEIEEFHKITRNELQNLSKESGNEIDHFNSLLTDSGFLNSYHAEYPSEVALEKFLSYYHQHSEIFTDWVKTFCMNSVIKVAESYDGIVTEEKEIIVKIKEAFDK